MPSFSAGDKQRRLDAIASTIAQCEECQKQKVGVAVPGEGNPDADVAVLGEAPGKQEADTGRPFIGQAGAVLEELLECIGLQREDVFITSPVKYLPEHTTPTRAEIAHGFVHTEEQLHVIEPKIIVLLGKSAIQAVFPEQQWKLQDIHGTAYADHETGRMYFFTYHPAAALRSPYVVRSKIEQDFAQLKHMIAQ